MVAAATAAAAVVVVVVVTSGCELVFLKSRLTFSEILLVVAHRLTVCVHVSEISVQKSENCQAAIVSFVGIH